MGNCKCPVCNTDAYCEYDHDYDLAFYQCKICGRFELSEQEKVSKFNPNHLASYLAYNAYLTTLDFTPKYHTVLAKEKCDYYKEEYKKGKKERGYPINMDSDIVENWYPRTFTERIDYILLYLNKRTKHIGQSICLDYDSAFSAFFIDRYDLHYETGNISASLRKRDDCLNEVGYLLDYLVKRNLIVNKKYEVFSGEIIVTLSPEGYMRVEELQKNNSNGRNVFVAMKFGDETLKAREAISKGISDAGYNAILIDKVPHNNYIMPELLKQIKDCKFMVVDLTYKNQGAYFEEGYAMGLGKQVIQLCKKGDDMHFDIAQKNTIIWEKEENIPEMLTNRIKATID